MQINNNIQITSFKLRRTKSINKLKKKNLQCRLKQDNIEWNRKLLAFIRKSTEEFKAKFWFEEIEYNGAEFLVLRLLI